MSQNTAHERAVAQHLGMAATAKLRRWADWAARSLGCEVYLIGSVLSTKDWRDVDVSLIFTAETYERRVGAPGFWFLAAAYSALATEQVGLPVDVHIDIAKPNGTSLNFAGWSGREYPVGSVRGENR